MKSKIRVGYIGLGRRGQGMLKLLAEMKDVEIMMLCDLNEQKLEKSAQLLQEKGQAAPILTKDYHEILANPDVDAVFIMSGWHGHVQLAKESILAGKYTGVEVGCAYTLEECFDLVEAYEKTGAPLMMLENCCYDRREMMALNMVKQGLFGEIVHCKGGYQHYLNSCDLMCKDKDGELLLDHYRLTEYEHRNCEQYPTHEFGPISKVLGINRGNRLLSLASFASKSRGLKDYIKENVPADHPLQQKTFLQGDIVTTVLTCANGETVMLELDTTVPRPYYSRNFTVRGTRGMCTEERKCFFLEGMEEPVENNEEEFYEKYDHPLYKEYAAMDLSEEIRKSHGGMDWLILRAFVESVKRGEPTPIDAYDTATWMAIAPLSEMSIARGGAPVNFPDFTRGKWFHREPVTRGKYCLDEICEDLDTPIIP